MLRLVFSNPLSVGFELPSLPSSNLSAPLLPAAPGINSLRKRLSESNINTCSISRSQFAVTR